MPLLNPPNILPKAMFVIARALSGQRGKPVEKATLKAQLQPPSLPLRKDGTSTFDASLGALCAVGLARTEGSTVTYSGEAPADQQRFYDHLVTCILSDENITAEGVSPGDDLVAALTWWCAQDPHAEPVHWGRVQELLGHDLGASYQSFPIGNSNPWQTFARWALSLGFAERQSFGDTGGMQLVPDMTRAVKGVLRRSDLRGTVRIGELLGVVRAALPVVDGGRLALRWRPTWNLPPGRHALTGAVDRALSHALLRNDEDGVIGLDPLSDATKVTLSDGADARPISHVKIVGGVS